MIDDSAPSPWSAVLAVHRVAHRTLHVLSAELAGLGLTASEINALANLADGRSRTVSELSTATGTRPSTLTSVLDRLEGRGLVSRGGAPGDRRAVLIELTPGGRLAADTVGDAVTGLERRALGALPAGTVAGLRAALQALAGIAS